MWTIHIEAIALLLSKYPPIDGVRESQPTAVYGEVPPAKLPLPRYHFIYSYIHSASRPCLKHYLTSWGTQRGRMHILPRRWVRGSDRTELSSPVEQERIHRRAYEHASEVVSGYSHVNTLALMSTPRDEHNTISMRNRTFTIRR